MAIIEIKNLSYKYPTSRKQALNDVSLSVEQGEICAIVGANGSGKTSLAYAIRGFIPHFYKGTIEGEVLIKGENILDRNISEMADTVGIVIQNPFNQLSGVADTVYDELAFGLENIGAAKELIRERVENILNTFHFKKIRDMNPFELSGGQQQKVALASIMVMEPDIIVMDEPTSQTDPLSTEEIFSMIFQLKQKGKTIVLIEHKIELIARYADHVVVMADGKAVMDGKTEDVLSNPKILDYNLNAPIYTRLGRELQNSGFNIDKLPLTEEEAASLLGELLRKKGIQYGTD